MNTFRTLLLFFLFTGTLLNAQQADPQDFGKMWTFEEPPAEMFSQKYAFDANQEWFDDVRMASLKFASWCSASFVSPEGLIMTNYHCSGGTVGSVQKDGEDLGSTGFYAQNLEDERQAPGLFVDQLVKIEKVTSTLQSIVTRGEAENMDEAASKLKEVYAQKEEWKDLVIKVVDYYSGSKYSLYGYKRYTDVRLVFVPEMQMGLYGGDPDNFTYPRYSMDFTFWRAYDENGKPVNSSEHYFPFNINGADEGEAVFTVGNPARTERYRTVAQLESDRDYKYPMLRDFYNARYKRMQKQLAENPNPKLQNQLVYFGNGRKVINGIAGGLENEELFNRKVSMEKMIRSKVKSDEEWQQIESYMNELNPYSWAIQLLGPSYLKGASFMIMHSLAKYERQLGENAPENELQASREEIEKLAKELGTADDNELFEMTISEIMTYVPADRSDVAALFGDRSPEEYVKYLQSESALYQVKGLVDLLALDQEKLGLSTDPMLLASRVFPKAYMEAYEKGKEMNPKLDELRSKIARKTFKVLGESLSPDATFTNRISDGVVQGYEYNGTTAPYKTTFFGMYDRYYSRNDKGPWDLPEIWQNPTMDFLKSPANFVSTNDIIGGNSGSPIINKNKEIVGLVFDGNIESLPGNFIFDQEYNRTVNVHAGGIIAALQYIYKAKGLSMELLGKK